MVTACALSNGIVNNRLYCIVISNTRNKRAGVSSEYEKRNVGILPLQLVSKAADISLKRARASSIPRVTASASQQLLGVNCGSLNGRSTRCYFEKLIRG
jgi:outer membrane protein TolC